MFSAVAAFAERTSFRLRNHVPKLPGAMKKNKRQLILNKGTDKFIFRYDSGCEDELLDALIEQAKASRTNFDWFDAAVLSFKLTQSLIGQADELLCEDAKT